MFTEWFHIHKDIVGKHLQIKNSSMKKYCVWNQESQRNKIKKMTLRNINRCNIKLIQVAEQYTIYVGGFQEV